MKNKEHVSIGGGRRYAVSKTKKDCIAVSSVP
jgi:hypothetical protein